MMPGGGIDRGGRGGSYRGSYPSDPVISGIPLLVDLHLRVGVPGVLPLGEGCDEVRVMGEEAGQ